MIRFILNFIFFGVLFYAIAHFFPDAFERLVQWAEKVYTFFADLITTFINWVSEHTKSDKTVPEKTPSAIFAIQQLIDYYK